MNRLKKQTLLLSTLFFPAISFVSNEAAAGAEDDPVLSRVFIDQLEVRDVKNNGTSSLQGEGWIGKDLQKLWIKTDVGRIDNKIDDAEVQALYSQAVAPYWDFQAGLRNDFKPSPDRTWGVIGFKGLAPYFFDIDTALFFGENGRTAFRFEGEYDFLFTQKLILTPDIEINIYGQNDVATGVGSGLSDIESGLRLRYEIRREFAPYIGVNWVKKYGGSADMAKKAGETVDDIQLVLGVRAWF